MCKFEKFKNEEFLGDKLLDFIGAMYFIKNGGSRMQANKYTKEAFTNKSLNQTAVNLNIKKHEYDLTFPAFKVRANHYEFKVYKILIEKGFVAAYDFVVATHLIKFHPPCSKPYFDQKR